MHCKVNKKGKAVLGQNRFLFPVRHYIENCVLNNGSGVKKVFRTPASSLEKTKGFDPKEFGKVFLCFETLAQIRNQGKCGLSEIKNGVENVKIFMQMTKDGGVCLQF